MQETWPIWLDLQRPIPARALVLSLFLHALVFYSGLRQMDSWSPDRNPAEDHRQVTRLFLPARVPPRQTKSLSPRAAAPYPISTPSPPVVPDIAPSIANEPQVDLNAMELSFEDDGRNALPDVVRSFNGVFAFTEKRDPAFARYILEPPDWAIRGVMIDMGGRLRLSLSPAEKWTVLREAAGRYSLDLNDYDVSALFERPFAKCLQQAIRDRAPSNSRVRSARLAFAADRVCGVEVVSITTASTP